MITRRRTVESRRIHEDIFSNANRELASVSAENDFLIPDAGKYKKE
jgi:hypothetical protein